MSEFFIAKHAAEKNAFRMKDEKSIDRFFDRRIDLDKSIANNMHKAIRRVGNYFIADCIEYSRGVEVHPGDIIAFEKVEASKNTPHEVNIWVLGKNAKIDIREVDGEEIIYSVSKPVPAIEYNNNIELKRFIENHSDAHYFDDNVETDCSGACIKTSWGTSRADMGTSLCVCYGYNDFNFLNKNTESYNQYYLCDEAGKPLD